MARVLHFDRASIQLTRFDVMHMANAAHLKTVLASLAGLSTLFCAYAASAHSSIGLHQSAPCNATAGVCAQQHVATEEPAAETWLVAAGDARIGGGMPRRINPGAAGVIDRSVPKSGSAAGTPEGNLTQFNRIPDTSNFAGAAGTAGIAGTTGQAALPDLDGGPVLYTIMERPAPQQARPVLYKPANAAQPSSKGSAKRYCTVTEVLRSTAACQ